VLYNTLQDIKVIAEANPIEEVLIARKNLSETENEDMLAENRLEEFLFSTGPWYELELFDTKGNYLLDATEYFNHENITGRNQEKQLAYSFVMSNKETYVSDLVLDNGKPTVIFAAPVRDESIAGKPIVGVVIGNFAWPVIEEILQGLGVHHAHLYNKEGYLLASNEIHDKSVILNEQNIDIIQHHAKEGDTYDVELSNEGTFESLKIHIVQQGHLSYRGNDWLLLLETPTDIAFSQIENTTQRLLLAGLILLILTVIVAFFVARSIANPISNLQDSAKKISRGNFDEKIEVKTSDEIGELAETFDNMRYSLKMVIDEYEKMKGKEEMQKKVERLEKKQAETIKKLRVAISEQKIASAAEQKALQKYREMEKKSRAFIKE
jgi:HAMP domain-containing protein